MTALPVMSHRGRLARLRGELTERTGVAAALVTDPSNLRWCSGFSGSTGWLALLGDRAVLGTDRRYEERAVADVAAVGLAEEVEVIARVTQAEQRELMTELFRGETGVGAEATHLSHARWSELASVLPVQPADAAFRVLRRSKDAAELARIELAAEIADAALAQVTGLLRQRPTEVDVRDELEYLMRRLGADGPSYATIVASGPVHAARPHHGAERRVIDEHDTVVIDVGALVDGYHSDMTRSWVIGEPSARQQEIYRLVLEAQLAGLAVVGPGVATRDVDRACREIFEEAGYGDWYLHATGHGVGLDIHEDPFHNATSDAVLVPGDVVTVEPGLYRAGFGGFRIEDLVVVTQTGHRILTHTPKDVSCLPSPPTT